MITKEAWEIKGGDFVKRFGGTVETMTHRRSAKMVDLKINGFCYTVNESARLRVSEIELKTVWGVE